MLQIASMLRVVAGAVLGCWLVAATALPARAQTPETPSLYDPDHLASARAFIDATGGADLMEQVLSFFLPKVGEIIRESYPEITDAKYDRFMELFAAAFREQRPMFRQATDRIFAEYLSKADLEAGVAFYTSPAGRHFIEMRPKIAEDMRKGGKESMAEMTVNDLAPHLTMEERQAYAAFVESEAGKRLAEAQSKILVASAQFGARIGRHVSPLAGARALEQMEKEGNGL